jgi:hypothetical protein
MPVPTLTNFGVPTGANTGRAGILMPKVKNRFRVTMLNFGGQANAVAFTQQVTTVSRPNLTMAPQEIHSYNSIAYYPGKATWETITVTTRDDMTNNISMLVGNQMMQQMNFFEQTVAPSAHDYKFQMWIDTLDGGNVNVLEQWIYEGCFLSAVNYESFDYSSSDAMTIEMTVRFDNATQSGGTLMPDPPVFTSGPETYTATS